jgi:hypothetical protein
MASKARAAHEHVTAEAEKGRRDRQHADDEFLEAAVVALKRDVVPLLTEAMRAFAEDGIKAGISEDFDVRNRGARAMPRVSFRCLGHKRATDGYQFEAAAVFFASDGNTVFAGAAESSIDRDAKRSLGLAPIRACEGLVTKAVETALTAYFNERDRWK